MFPISKLQVLEIEPSSYCNAGCPLCIRHIKWTSKEQPNLIKRHLTYEQIQFLFADIKTIQRVILCGVVGDSLMNPSIFNIVEFISNISEELFIDTNGSIRSEEFWGELGKLSKKKNITISFAIDGLEDTNHIYRVNTDFNKIIQNATAYINAGGRAVWKYIVFKHNEHQIEEANAFATKLGFEVFTTEHSSRWDRDDIDHIINNNPILQPSSLVQNKLQYKMKGVGDAGVEYTTTQCISCKSLTRSHVFVDANFDLWPCCFFGSEVREFNRKIYWDPYWKSIEDMYGENFNNLNTTNLATLLEHPYFIKTLPASWESTTQQYLCKIFCNESQYWDKQHSLNDNPVVRTTFNTTP